MSPGRGSSAIAHDDCTSRANSPRHGSGNLGSMEPSPGLTRFTEVVGREDFTLDQAALLIGAWEYPERDLDEYRGELDAIAARAAPDVARAANGTERASAISDHLFDRLG